MQLACHFIPDNVTLALLPELNPVERVWLYLYPGNPGKTRLRKRANDAARRPVAGRRYPASRAW